MDALPLKETTGVPYASTAVVKDLQGRDQPAMHACGHDVHMTSLIGAARTLAAAARPVVGHDRLHRPARRGDRRRRAGDARRRPLHALPEAGLRADVPRRRACCRPARSATARGRSCRASARWTSSSAASAATARRRTPPRIRSCSPRRSSSRCRRSSAARSTPGTRAVVTVGTIHGGLKRNIIPDDVKLELTLRAFDPAVMAKLVVGRPPHRRRHGAGGRRARRSAAGRHRDRGNHRRDGERSGADPAPGQASSPSGWAPIACRRSSRSTPARTSRSTARRRSACRACCGASAPRAPEKFAESARTGVPVPSNHNSGFAPVPEPTITAGVTTMTAAVLELLAKK